MPEDSIAIPTFAFPILRLTGVEWGVSACQYENSMCLPCEIHSTLACVLLAVTAVWSRGDSAFPNSWLK